MATQTFYLSNTAAETDPAITGWWDNTTSDGASALTDAPAGASTEHSGTAGAGGDNVLLQRWVSPEITTAGTLEASGVVADFVSAVEASASGTQTSWGIRVVDSSGADRGTFLAATAGGPEWPTTRQGWAETTPDSFASSVNVEPGDRVVIEFGFAPSSGGDTGSVLAGGTGGTDLAPGDTGGDTTRPGSVTFTGANSSDLWESTGDPDPPVGDGVNLSTNPACGADTADWNDGPYAGSTGTRATGLSGFSRDTGFELTAAGYTETPLIEVDEGVEYTFQCEVRVPSSETGVTVWLDWFDTATDPQAADLVSADQQDEDFTADEVRTVAFTGTAPAGATSCIFAFNSLPVGTVFTAQMAAPEGTEQTYADGETTDWEWDGAQYNSTSRYVEPAEIEIIAVYDDAATPPGATVTDVQEGDWLLACLGLGYADASAVTVSGTGPGTWESVLATANVPEAGPDFENYGTAVWRLVATGTGTYEVDTDADSGEHGLVVLHLRGADTVDDTSLHIDGQDGGVAATNDVGGVAAGADGSLLVCGWGGVQFSGPTVWTIDSGSLTEQAQPQTGSGFGAFVVGTETVDSGGTGTRTATAAPAPTSGFAGFALVISPAEGGTEPLPDTAAERYGWGTPLPASDEFDYTGAPDPTKWGVYDGAGHDGNGVRDPAQVTVQDGYLRIEGDANGNSGGLAASFNQQYGRWECRARFASTDPAGESYHPVLIVWPESERWPEDGEYDWVEIEDLDTDQIQAYLHYPHPPGGGIEQEYVTGPSGIDFTQWHNFAFEWVEGSLRGFLDGVEWFSLDGSMTSSNGRRLDSMPSGHLTIQLDNFTGSSGLQPAYFDVEWARVYSAEGSSEVRSADGSAPVELGATGTGSKAADAAGAAPAALGVSGTATRTATATGTARMRLATDGTGSAERTSAGTAPAALATAGAGSKAADTAGEVAPVRLGAEGTATGVPINTRVGTAAATLDATGTGRKVATATGTARLGLATAGSGSKTTDGAGTVEGLALQEDADSDRTADGTGQAPPVLLATAGSTDGRTADRVSGTAPAYLAADGTGTRETDAHGAVSALLRAAGTGAGLRAAEGSAGPLAVTAAGTGTREADASGTARMRLTAEGIAFGSGGVAIRYGTADPLGLAARGTGRKVATTTGQVSGLALAAGAAPLRPGRVTVTSGGPDPVSITVRGTGLRVRAANA